VKILVTGATGYVGSHLVKSLADYGHTVTGTDFNLEQNNILPYCNKVVDWDIRRPTKIIIDEYDTVIHLAALTMVSLSVQNPYPYYQTNIFGTQNVLDSIKHGHFIYCSTGAAFQPETSPYAMSKRSGEDLLLNHKNHTVCRFYNVSGTNGFKKFDDSYYHIIRRAAAVASGMYPSLTINGNDYDTRDGTTIRNYTHVQDIIDALVKIVEHGATNQIECLGTTTGSTVLEVVDTMRQVSGVNIETVVGPRRPGDSIISVLPNQSNFFTENHSLVDQCVSTLSLHR